MTMAATLSRWLIGFGSIGLLAMTAIIGWQVFGRFVLNSSPSWTEQASLIMMIWYVMFAAAAGVYEGFHIRIALLEEKLGDRARPLLRIVALVIAAIGAACLRRAAVLGGARQCRALARRQPRRSLCAAARFGTADDMVRAATAADRTSSGGLCQ